MPHSHRREPESVALTTHPTELGTMVLAATDDALVYCGFDEPVAVRRRLTGAGLRETPVSPQDGAEAQVSPQEGAEAQVSPQEGARPSATVLTRARTQLDAYLAGTSRTFRLPLDLRLATPFSRQTVLALEDFVPYGRTATYKELATAMARPRAARAVGTALGANPLCVVLPCHRIVGSTGRLTGYAGGVPAKRFLLDLEARPEAAPCPSSRRGRQAVAASADRP
ncbi:methylated-DNA--[protein]-cysteine S-methyltransferase [Streptomyces sp. NBC_01775]|uniref:methylated-DNA--[protein]-cysteine S-methyltransferase n=1 Tax=Streptomyces sp. NBC_01775 TaxID=2975939 RepID=UPI002DD97DF7|nr:methylated-DNA--[protein]-cysteine S-methyltransferase [Streptomyces sp. NBC_01775]WSB79303.1 methylated-DNA--[protein]-cysteine S-methyltransferase [Streptomyces sp. NBC_01775]